MLKLYTASSKNYYFFEEEIINRVRNNKADFIVILPVNRAVRLLKRKMVDAAPNKTIVDANVFTFNELFLKIYTHFPDSKRIIQTETQRLFISHILKTYKNDFNYFPVKSTLPESSAIKIADIVSELRRFGYSAERFEKIVAEHSAKQDDFCSLLRHLETMLQPNLIDEPFALFSTVERLSEPEFLKHFPQVRDIYISGYELFTPAMINFIEKAKEWLPVHLKLTYNKDNDAVFKHVKDAYNQFKDMSAEIIEEKIPTLLSQHLLTHQSDAIIQAEEIDTRYYIHELKNRKEEIEFIAALVRQFHLRDHIPLHRIAVTFANLDRYVPLIRNTFKEHGLPYNLSTGFNLNQSPLIQTFINAIKLVESNFEFKKVLDLINNQFLMVPQRIELTSVFKIITKYRVEYLTRSALDKLTNYLSRDKKNSDMVDQLKALSDFLTPFYTFPKKEAIPELRNSYIGLLKSIGLLDWYKTDISCLDENSREKEFRSYNRFMKLFDKFIWSYTCIDPNKKISLKDFIRYLQSQVNNAAYSLSEKSDFGVQINPRLEIQALEYDILIVGGLIDGEFPRESVKDVFFNDAVRKKMGLIATENLLDQDRFIFYSLLDSQAKKIYLTYPKYEQDRVLPVSTFLSDFREIYPAAEPDPLFDNLYMKTLNHYWVQLGEDIFKQEKNNSLHDLELILDVSGIDSGDQIKDVLHRMNALMLRFSGILPSIYEGGLTDNQKVKDILAGKYSDVTWSASKLEEYAFCPMKFFYNRILKIEEWPEFEEEFTPLERGNLLHNILFRFYSEIPHKNEPLRYQKRLIEIAEEELARLPYSGFFANLEKIRYCGTDNKEGFLNYFVNYDQEQINENGYIPAHFELSFGMKNLRDADPISISDPVVLNDDGHKLLLQGRIDRVDLNDSGSALIFDYKTGTTSKKIKLDRIQKGLTFQLPLYMLALPHLINNYSADYSGYYFIKNREECERHTLIADKNSVPVGKPKKNYLPDKKFLNENGEEITLDEILQMNLKQAINRITELREGNFRLSLFPKDEACQSYCDFRKMCQKNPAKMERIAESIDLD